MRHVGDSVFEVAMFCYTYFQRHRDVASIVTSYKNSRAQFSHVSFLIYIQVTRKCHGGKLREVTLICRFFTNFVTIFASDDGPERLPGKRASGYWPSKKANVFFYREIQ